MLGGAESNWDGLIPNLVVSLVILLGFDQQTPSNGRRPSIKGQDQDYDQSAKE